MEAGIVGLPNVGKSTLFNALTNAKALAANYPFATIEPNEGIVPVPDSRLERITKYIPPQKVIPASVKIIDIAGIVEGASKGEGLGNKFLTHIRLVDAILQVVRCFEDGDITHVAGSVDPLRDIAIIENELLLADMQTLESALPKAQRAAKTGNKEEATKAAILEKALAKLNDGLPIRELELSNPDDRKLLAGYGLITAKKMLYIANVDENDLQGQGELCQKVRAHAAKTGGIVVPVCAKIESELNELEPADRKEMLEAVGLAEPGLVAVSQAVYKLLGLQSYFTAGETEVRAWTIPIGATGPQAAGVIHTDFEKGYIRAEVYQLEDLEKYHSEKAIREAGRMRTEGKNYVMQDGDICHFLFSA